MKTIYKYSISTDDRETKIWVPVRSTPIFTGLDPNKVPSIWVEVDLEVDDEEEMCVVVVGRFENEVCHDVLCVSTI